jgi:hypothetical protein
MRIEIRPTLVQLRAAAGGQGVSTRMAGVRLGEGVITHPIASFDLRLRIYRGRGVS